MTCMQSAHTRTCARTLVHLAVVRMLCHAVQLSDMDLIKQQSNVMAALKQGNAALKKAQQEVRRRQSHSPCR